ncbi:hypothetical protein LEP1GSC186_2892 [Leptospira noguchii serovar Autumnalis str. ZUN142]|uniref:Uncharacterized protein n=1 Tax=Leptospira noguchii serovar Autumnalis str. ZUN142 TaxID=1085540 RepID=M6U7A3_9LEPT|nr:hypothetical protein LEP1GSC186_2892 [Leptospira noguchii serovar Autumnalis str. ZUN142]
MNSYIKVVRKIVICGSSHVILQKNLSFVRVLKLESDRFICYKLLFFKLR